ncbi:MAG TPA: DUF4394 domain-containing protein [Phycisphaerales bacterium]|nr:DUF4394 domain-containing protein [Phycisphaerales bacterium]
MNSRSKAITFSALSLAVVSGLAAPASAQQMVYAIGGGGTSLVRFMSNDPSNVTVVGNFGGAASFLDAIDFRPQTGQLYGYLDATDSYYTVDVTTGALTLASGGPTAPTNTFQLGMDFNPTIDRARVITDSDQNIVFNPAAGTSAAFTDLFYSAGDANEGADPNVIDNAYTQNFAGSMATQQYAIDYGLDALVKLANNAGTLTTVGSLGIDTDIYTGFDIYTAGGVDTAYAILTAPSGAASFYTIDLATGQATLVGELGMGTQVYSLAVIPAPASMALAGLGALLTGPRRRR